MIEVKIPEDSSLVFDFDKNNEEKPVSIGVSYIEPGKFNKTMVVLAQLNGAQLKDVVSKILEAKNQLLKACTVLEKRKELSESGLSV